MHISCIVVCGALQSPFASPRELCSSALVDTVYAHNFSQKRRYSMSSYFNGVRDDALQFIEHTMPPLLLDRQNSSIFFIDSGAVGGSYPTLPTYNRVAVGGTFDRLHNGHRKLLTLAAALSHGSLVVGVMAAASLQKKTLASLILPYEDRVKSVIDFLHIIKPALEVHIFQLTDPYGPAITDAHIEALVVSSETISGVGKINEIRAARGFAAVAGVVVRREDVSILSSTFMRQAAVAQVTS